MSDNLYAFLTSIGAKLTQDLQCEFPDTPTHANVRDNLINDSFITPLSYYGLLAIEGADTATFLQGQTTCNINDINDQHSLPGAYCTAKGRMVSNFRVARNDQQTYLLRMRRQIVTNTKNVFGKYIVFSKAQQRDSSDDFIILGLYGHHAQMAITNTFGTAPKVQNEVVVKKSNIAIQLDETGLRYECWIHHTDINQLWPSLSQDLTPLNSALWQLQNIRLGLGEVTEKTLESFIPQMLNYQLTGEINFKKGCYTGQEIVARMHYRGKLKRQMYHIEIETCPPLPGTELYRNNTNQSIGNIVNAISTGKSSCEALAVITIDSVENNNVVIGPEQTSVKILSLPYAINNKGDLNQ